MTSLNQTPINVVNPVRSLKALSLDSIKRKIQTNIFDIRLLTTQNEKMLSGQFFRIKANNKEYAGKYGAYCSIASLSPNGETLMINVRLLTHDRMNKIWVDHIAHKGIPFNIDHLELLNGRPKG